MSSRIIDDPSILNELIHVHVFGGSVEPTADETIVEALRPTICRRGIRGERYETEFMLNGYPHTAFTMNRVGREDETNHAGLLEVWNDRHGKPYQADIEAHVAAYRGHIPDYVGDASWLAKGIAKVTQSGKDVWFGWTLGNRFAARYEDVDGKNGFIADDLSIAFWNAAIRACGYAEGSE